MRVELHPVRAPTEEELEGVEDDVELSEMIPLMLCSVEDAVEFMIFTADGDDLTWRASFADYVAAIAWGQRLAANAGVTFFNHGAPGVNYMTHGESVARH